MHGQDSLAASFARLFAPLSIPGILAGWMIGGSVDVGLNILRMFPMGDKAANYIKSQLQPGKALIDEVAGTIEGPKSVQQENKFVRFGNIMNMQSNLELKLNH